MTIFLIKLKILTRITKKTQNFENQKKKNNLTFQDQNYDNYPNKTENVDPNNPKKNKISTIFLP